VIPTAVQIVRLEESLPDDFEALRAEAIAEGYNFVDGLQREWSDGDYSRGDGRRATFAAFAAGSLAGIGAVTPDPYDPEPDLMRIRHVYVRPGHRGTGAGRMLAAALLQQGLALASRLSLHAADQRAAAFWESLGFRPAESGIRRTHLLTR
jgi:GNAT superfamily N-acetyltransferase